MSFLDSLSYGQGVATVSFLILFLSIELLLRRLKRKKRKEFNEKKLSVELLEQIEDLSIEHYKQIQNIDSVRFLMIILGVILILSVYNVQAFNILAVATGAFILALRESFTSLVAYFYILSNFKLGDDIRVGTFLGEIVRVKPLYTAIAGKDDNGEYNSRLHHIPNFMFLNQIVDQQQLKSDDYVNVAFSVFYSSTAFPDSFDVWTKKVEGYLEELLPKRVMKKVGYFKGYVGIKYKMSSDYNDKGEILVKISFITRFNKKTQLKEAVIQFVESLKVNK